MFVLAELRCSRFIIDIGLFSVIILKLNDLAHKYTSFLAFAQVVVNLYTCFPEYKLVGIHWILLKKQKKGRKGLNYKVEDHSQARCH